MTTGKTSLLNSHHHHPTEAQIQKMRSINSMNFIAADNRRHEEQGSRGVRAMPTSISAVGAQWVAFLLVGAGVAFIVNILNRLAESLQDQKNNLVAQARSHGSVGTAFLVHFALSALLISGSFLCVMIAPFSKGSGLPGLIAYLNGIKLERFTSSRVLICTLFGTALSIAAGLCVGPEGPTIHIGACGGKQMLRALVYLGIYANKLSQRGVSGTDSGTLRGRARRGVANILSAVAQFRHMQNDMDQRDFVAIGAGAGIAVAFSAPISATLFVVEEASSHFSVSLLWRTFVTALAALFVSHWCKIGMSGFLGVNGEDADKSWVVKFEAGVGADCLYTDQILIKLIPLAVLGGLMGAAFNELVLFLQRLRDTYIRGRKPFLYLEVLTVVLITSTVAILVPEAFACKQKTVLGLNRGTLGAQESISSAVCMSFTLRDQLNWSFNPVNSSDVYDSASCNLECLNVSLSDPVRDMLAQTGACSASEYSPLGSLLKQVTSVGVQGALLAWVLGDKVTAALGRQGHVSAPVKRVRTRGHAFVFTGFSLAAPRGIYFLAATHIAIAKQWSHTIIDRFTPP